MKIVEFVNSFQQRFSSLNERIRISEKLFREQSNLHIADLDLALILVALALENQKNFVSSYFDVKDELVQAIADSSYAKYFAPSLFKSEVVTVDDQKRQSDIKSNVKMSLSLLMINAEGKEAIYQHELLSELDVRLLDEAKSNTVNFSDKIRLEVRCKQYYSFALSQTGYRLLSDIIITNLSDETIKDGKLEFAANPLYFEISSIEVPLINPHQSVSIVDFDVHPKLDQLMSLQERIEGSLTVKFLLGEEEAVSLHNDIHYYSFDTWLEKEILGSSALFITPNDIAVKNIVAYVAKELEKLTGDASLEGYQSGDKTRVASMVKSLYNVLHDQGIAYISAPPSYEKIGQKVRLPHDVLVHKQGTCLDLSFLFASCLEAMQLNPFIVIKSGHAFAGVFLDDECFSTLVSDDPSSLLTMNSEEENQILLIECTSFTAGSSTTFEESLTAGRSNVSTSLSDPLFEAIDVVRARAYGFLPLPIQYDDVERAIIDYEVVEQNKIRLARKDYSYEGGKMELSEAALNRFDVWEKKLLDLTKRNQLVSYKMQGRALQLFVYNLNQCYQAFKRDNGQYHLKLDIELKSDLLELPASTQEEFDRLEMDLNQRIIHLAVRNKGQETSLRFFEKQRKKSFEETGSNILYLALGFVQYFETIHSLRPSYAPIILVPIDLVRHSKDNYSMKGREEPAFLNISIFEYFHQEFGLNCDDLLTQIKFEEEDLNIDEVLNTISERIKELRRATVIRAASINIYNFSKAVMWSDIRFRKNELSQNKVIQSILNGHYELDDHEKIDDTYDDDESNPEDLAIPLPADSSQIIAIEDCAKGKSFIMQGPPGTGKSQTITNMIVNAIYHGKTVLFVAEKMAALNVVRKRLEQLCLGQFALEAHSAKADKSSLMEQFEKRISFGSSISSSEDHLELASRLKEERKALNRVINLLHKENGYCYSFYDAFVRYLEMDPSIPSIPLSDKMMHELDEKAFIEANRVIVRLNDEVLSNGGYRNNPFLFYRNEKYIPGVSKRELQELTAPYQNALKEFIDAFHLFNTLNGVNIKDDERSINALERFIHDEDAVMLASPHLIGSDRNSYDEKVSAILNSALAYQKEKESLLDDFNSKILEFDFEYENGQYRNLASAFFIKKMVGRKKLLKKVHEICKIPSKYKANDLPSLYERLRDFSVLENQLLNDIAPYQLIFGDLNKATIKEFDFVKFEHRYLSTKKVMDDYQAVFGDAVTRELVYKSQSFSLKGKDEFLSKKDNVLTFGKMMQEKLGFDFNLATRFGIGTVQLLEMSNKWLARLDYLPAWCSLLSAFKEAKDLGLDFMLDYLVDHDLDKYSLSEIYRKSVYEHIISRSIRGDEDGSFNSVELDQRIKHYKELIDTFTELTIKETASRVSSRMPSINDKSASSSQQGILNKAVKNRCRGKSIRQLFSEIPDILTRIFPVFLMSPMSCAQYLSPDMKKFDVVIFDEASQMPTGEAIGAIARGNSLIVVGDSKQMPPTSFFQAKGSEDMDVDLEDQESILDDCDVIGMPSRCLSWHYRSKHESLIRFSNAKFYNNRLVTFPSPNDMVTKVRLVNTGGVYGEKKATNEIEAKAIIKEVERRLSSPELRKRSIGIVTFSSVQQEVIDDMLQDLFAKRRDLEKFNNESNEPIIVKNLENIQGDERDVILFSICYGPDKRGVMHYRFGPINNVGGEKRLNVAVSRARYEMIVFTSFEPERLANMKTDSRGALELYHFLKYAKLGADALTIPNGASIENRVGFEQKIAEALNEKGYQTNIDVGKSTFRVDIGIVHPDDPDSYILGVLCDSYSYESALTAKDRNIVQPNALGLLGWNLLRVWSFDYLDNPNKVIDTIVERIEDIRFHPGKYFHDENQTNKVQIDFETKEVEVKDYSTEYNAYMEEYQLYDTPQYNRATQIKIISSIMDMEAPISQEVLRNRFAHALGVTRAGSSIQSDMMYALRAINAKKNNNPSKSKVFFWKTNQDLELNYYRVGGAKPRAMDDVPKEEIIVAIREVLENNGPISVDELKRLVAKAFSIKSVGRVVSETLDDTISYYRNKGVLVSLEFDTKIGLKSQQ